MDVDLSTDLDALLPLVAPLVSGHSDVAIGSRLAPGSHVARHPKRELISRSYNLILRTLLATRVRDAQCGFKAVRASVARRLLPAVEDDGWFFDTELLLLAERNGLRIHEVPVDWIDDVDSRVKVVSTAIGDLKGTARMAVRVRDRRRPSRVGSGHACPARERLRPPLRRLLAHRYREHAVSLALFLLSTRSHRSDPCQRGCGNGHVRRQRVGERPLHRTQITPALGAARSALYGGSIFVTTAALAVVDTVTTSLAAQVAVLVVTWLIAAVVRFFVIGSS